MCDFCDEVMMAEIWKMRFLLKRVIFRVKRAEAKEAEGTLSSPWTSVGFFPPYESADVH